MLLLLALGCGPTTPTPARAPDVEVAEEGRLRLVAVGDTGTVNAVQRKVADAMAEVCAARGCDLGLLLGDNLYPRGMTSPDDPTMDAVMAAYRDLPFPLYGSLGNHDYGHGWNRQRASWQLAWAVADEQVTMPAPYYRFTAGPADLWALDTNLVFWWGGDAQAAWLEETVPASDARWKVAFGHHPYRSLGRHGHAGAYEGWRHVPFLSGAALEALFREQLCGRIDLYLSGHDHSLQWLEECGTSWVISGGGSRVTPVAEGSASFAAGEEGFVWIELTPDTMTVAFYDEEGEVLLEAEQRR